MKTIWVYVLVIKLQSFQEITAHLAVINNTFKDSNSFSKLPLFHWLDHIVDKLPGNKNSIWKTAFWPNISRIIKNREGSQQIVCQQLI